MAANDPHKVAARFVREAGGHLVGRTRLQKVAYLTQLAGFGDDLDFEYRHYGPFSEDLATGMEIARAMGFVEEEEAQAQWGGRYSVYRVTGKTPEIADADRARFVVEASKVGAIELELAATAAFLHVKEKVRDPWAATAKLKPEKATTERLAGARRAYQALRAIKTPTVLPDI